MIESRMFWKDALPKKQSAFGRSRGIFSLDRLFHRRRLIFAIFRFFSIFDLFRAIHFPALLPIWQYPGSLPFGRRESRQKPAASSTGGVEFLLESADRRHTFTSPPRHTDNLPRPSRDRAGLIRKVSWISSSLRRTTSFSSH